MIPIALAEGRMLFRNTLVAASAVLIPLGLGVFLAINAAGGSLIAILQVVLMAGMGVYVTATTTLAARRQSLFLKRLRSGSAPDGQIVAGLILPAVVVSLVQVSAVLIVLAVVGTPPQNPWLLALAVVVAHLMFAGFALATSGVTNSPEHAQVTTLPLFFLATGAAAWVAFSGFADATWIERLVPGGALAELIALAWDGGDMAVMPLLVVVSVGWGAAAAASAWYFFRWEPRR